MSLTRDQKITRFGTADGHEPINLGLKANATVYRGSIAVSAAGIVHPATTVASTDVCWGMIDHVGPGQIDGGPGITGGSTDGAVTVEIATGSFFLGSSTGADQLSVATLGATVYVYDETNVAATNGSTSRPIAGTHVGIDTTGQYPGAYAIKLGSAQGSP